MKCDIYIYILHSLFIWLFIWLFLTIYDFYNNLFIHLTLNTKLIRIKFDRDEKTLITRGNLMQLTDAIQYVWSIFVVIFEVRTLLIRFAYAQHVSMQPKIGQFNASTFHFSAMTSWFLSQEVHKISHIVRRHWAAEITCQEITHMLFLPAWLVLPPKNFITLTFNTLHFCYHVLSQ